MRNRYDLDTLSWQLAGFAPYGWTFATSMEIGAQSRSEVPVVPAKVPGSVQGALLAAELVPDWNIGLQAKDCEWVENRHWIYETHLPDGWFADRQGGPCHLHCLGLDYSGWIFLNGEEVATFQDTVVPHEFDLSGHLKANGNILRIIFDCPPRWLGQFGYTSRMTQWKPRFNYTWDWEPRLVQIGIWDDLYLDFPDSQGSIDSFRCQTDYDLDSETGYLNCHAQLINAVNCSLSIRLKADDELIIEETIYVQATTEEIELQSLSVAPWFPNGHGQQPLYDLTVDLLNKDGQVLDSCTKTIGFKHVAWTACKDAPEGADPWICNVNGQPIFLQGVNWTPILPNFADVTEQDYANQLHSYRDMGLNILRVWGGAILEKECFYDLCDQLGIMVWQEFPLSSSGTENWPPEDPAVIAELVDIASSYIERRQHHASLLLWCGGNELQGSVDGTKMGIGKPVTMEHPLMQEWQTLIDKLDPGRRFLASSASGPRFCADQADFGKGLHWDVHGPWSCAGDPEGDWRQYWENDDALFRSELGCPGTSSVKIIEEYSGGLPVLPGDVSNPLWRRTLWWIQWDEFQKEFERDPESIGEFVIWSQTKQARALEIAVRACKQRFPGIGGVILWMGRDAFPCTANTAVFDFHGRPKPAALAVAKVFREPLAT